MLGKFALDAPPDTMTNTYRSRSYIRSVEWQKYNMCDIQGLLVSRLVIIMHPCVTCFTEEQLELRSITLSFFLLCKMLRLAFLWLLAVVLFSQWKASGLSWLAPMELSVAC